MVQRVALAAIALALIAGEFIAPTRWAQKKTSHEMQNAVATSALDANTLNGLPPIDELALGSIDVIGYDVGDGKVLPLSLRVPVPRNARIVLIGWCADPQARLPAGGAFVSVDGRERIDGSMDLGGDRPDVAVYYHDPDLRRTGFRIEFDASLLGTGTRELQFAVIAHDRRGFFPLSSPLDVTVAPS
jgi:hypothetical protein